MAHLSLSARGRAIHEEVVPLALGLERRLLSVLTAREQKMLDQLLTKLSAGDLNQGS